MTAAPDPAALPPDAILAVDPAVLAGALVTIPDGENALLRLADGRRTVEEVIAGSGLDVSHALASLGRLLDGGVLRLVPPGAATGPSEPDGPERASWFADPAADAVSRPEAPAPSPEAAAPVLAAPPVRPVAPAGRVRARAWVLAAAVVAGTTLLGGAWWMRRQRSAGAGGAGGVPVGAAGRGAATPGAPPDRAGPRAVSRRHRALAPLTPGGT